MQDIDEAGEVLLEGGRSTCVCVCVDYFIRFPYFGSYFRDKLSLAFPINKIVMF